MPVAAADFRVYKIGKFSVRARSIEKGQPKVTTRHVNCQWDRKASVFAEEFVHSSCSRAVNITITTDAQPGKKIKLQSIAAYKRASN